MESPRLNAAPSYPLSDALASGVPAWLQAEAYHVGRIDLTRPDGPPIPFLLPWRRDPARSNGGDWFAKRHARGRTFTGYAGGHQPRGGGIAGLSAQGVSRAVAGLDRQEYRWASGDAKPRPPWRPCPTCNRPMPLAV